jgi:branched-chain amino acid transport system substrate-binding protein
MEAINTAKSTDSKKICSALAKIKVTSAACGAFTYDKNHNPIKNMAIVTVKNGKYVTVK